MDTTINVPVEYYQVLTKRNTGFRRTPQVENFNLNPGVTPEFNWKS
ncbi:MAG: hypothetical protein FWE95_09270 [Planctomycetaceae bacterium]|nr:hypothetical protein [Planctomycetaceae bacterium]